ncbi:MAG: O-antigen ligase family protein [Bacteroidales bacterium]|nr:O-antigen ligase family protein [Bacteroidales bacterium]
MPPLHLKYLPISEIAIALLLVLLPISNSNILINGIQTAKSFNFLYGMLALAGIASIGFLFKSGKLKLNITAIDVLLLAFVVWLTLNKYLLQEFHSLSLRYFELLGLVVLYIILRTLKTKYALFLLLAICISGAVQAVYGNLQLWGRYPSHHGLFKMTGSFFNPGPYAGYLCAVLPVAVGLYWMHINSKFQISSLTTLRSVELRFRLRLNLLNWQLGTWNLKPLIIKYLTLITIISILLVLPAARSRAAWLGAIAGVAYLAWHKYNLGELLKQRSVKRRSHQTRSIKLFNNSIRVRNSVLVTMLVIVLAATTLGLYHYKKDSADGRLLIWTVTANIIKDKPLLGVGHDRFKAHYMDYQADYFLNNPGSKYETVADDNQYAFNEPLLTWSENGLIGLLLLGGIVLAVFNSMFQVSSFRLTQSGTWNLKPETERSVVKPETIIRATILSILVFGLFAYPSEILPIKMVAITCLGLLANYFALNTSNIESESNMSVASTKHREVPRIGIKRIASNAKRSGASNGAAKPGTWNLKPVISIAILLLTIFAYPQISKLKNAHTTWKDAMDLYNYGLYVQCLTSYEKAYPVLKHNGEFLINYGKALSIAEKHTEAVSLLEQAKSYQSNNVLYTAMGDSHKALEEYEKAEQHYLQAANMTPGKFYPLYLLAKLYDTSGQQHKALEMANTILNKEVKLHSVAIEEIFEEMEKIIERNKYNEQIAITDTLITIFYVKKYKLGWGMTS